MLNSTRGLRRHRYLIALLLALGVLTPMTLTIPVSAAAAEPARHGAVGWDTYRRLDRLAEVGGDARSLQFSSFDRTGGNNDGFEGDHSCLRESDAGCVIAEHEGAGEIASIWFTRDGGDVTKTGKITIEVDGTTVVDAPLQEVVDGKLGAPFVHPLVANADQSSGGVYIKVPMPYTSSMRVTTEHNPLFYHVNYREFAESEGITAFDPADQALDVVEMFKAAGTTDPKPAAPDQRTLEQSGEIAPKTSMVLAETSTAGSVTGLEVQIPELATTPAVRHTTKAEPKPSTSGLDPRKARWIRPETRTASESKESSRSDEIMNGVRLRITFDGAETVDAPIGEFFGSGLGLYSVESLMFGIDPDSRTLRAWWPMPYASSAKVELYNDTDTAIGEASTAVVVADDPTVAERLEAGELGHFRTTTNRERTEFGRDHYFLDATGTGRVVGVTHTVEGLIPTGNVRNYLEGDERLFVDGSSSPDQHGTGTEDFYEGGWYFNRGTFNAPLNGNPAHEVAGGGCEFDCTGMYRLMLAEVIDFSSKIRFGIEHGPSDDADAIEGSTTYWYGAPERTLEWTDSLDVGDPDSEEAHGYAAAEPGEVVEQTSRFEGVDGPAEPVRLDGRSTTSAVTFTMAIAEDNLGVRLRRLSDQAQAGQSAAVTIDGEPAGVWAQPLGNETHRWLDDDFPLPPGLTAGKKSIEVTLTPTDGAPAWSATDYRALSRRAAAPDTEPPSGVGEVTATADERTSITLNWSPATDDDYGPGYQVYASTTAGFTPTEDDLVGVARAAGFVHRDLDVRQTWHYRVRAVDAAGQAGELSPEVKATTGDTVRVEGESLFADATATGPLQVQGNCCGVEWSGGAQLWFTPTEAGTVTASLELGTAGRYSLTGVQTLARDYGINVLRLDGEQVGAEFDAFATPDVVISDPIEYGTVELESGSHTLELEVTGKNADAEGFLAGLDYLQLELLD